MLRAWKLKSGGTGLLFPPAPKANRRSRFLDAETLGTHLHIALEVLGLPRLTWYSCTRHTFASQFVMGGGSIERLRLILGHSSVVVTERYAHLGPAHFGPRDLSAISVDLTPSAGAVVDLAARRANANRAADTAVTRPDEETVDRQAAFDAVAGR